MTTRDQEEQDLRINQMTINIDKMRADLAKQQKDLEWETRKFIVQAIVGAAACAGAGAAVMAYFAPHPVPPAPQPPVIIYNNIPAPPAPNAAPGPGAPAAH